ncbi:MAG TPA: methionine--tRNA ligase [Myxococcota bacterium]|nr:methionine--tRNA ligase [Myxococcota bacterium]HRY96349.1 methionine--tRNA ligase [Myxococcota bacterium]
MPKTFYVTTPIYYVNDVPHIGHAYTTIAADCLARHHRALGEDVRFLTGTDEHGQKIDKAAHVQGLEPIQLADRVVERFRALWRRFGMSNDDFIRTTEPRHMRMVQLLFERVRAQGDIYLGSYEGLYCTGCEEYYTETQVPDGLCPYHKKPLERMLEKSYFFRMSKYQQPLLEHIAAHPEFIQPEIRRNEIVSFVREGLRDLSVSRTSFRWGIPVPGDPAHVIYVWFDALSNYISALGWDGSPGGGEPFQRYWPAVHLIGKDILRFHAVYWPTFLLSAGLPLPRQVFAHGFWTVGGEKMSKSLRNVVEPNALLDAYGADAVRYFLLRDVPFGLDGDFSHQAITGRLNAELANDLGNLLRRAVTMCEKYTDGLVPPSGAPGGLEQTLVETALRAAQESAAHLEALAFHKALGSIWELVRSANRYIDEAGPWTLHKNGERERLHTVVYHMLEALRFTGVLNGPFMPGAARGILEQLGLGSGDEALRRERVAAWGGLPAGTRVRKGAPLFPRIEPERAAEIAARFQPGGDPMSDDKPRSDTPAQPAAPAAAPALAPPAAPAPAAPAPAAPAPGGPGTTGPVFLSIEDFRKVDLRVGMVRSAERVPKSDKLLKLMVDLGEAEPRQVVAGIGKAYAPESLVGKRIMVVANLKPAKLMGLESRAMVLAAGPGGEHVVIAEFHGELPPGESVH